MNHKIKFVGMIIKHLLLVTLIFFSAYSCRHAGPAVITNDSHENPVISFKNPFGRSITLFSPSAETGSIGVEAGGQIYWMKGEPERYKIDKQTTSYSWIINRGDKLTLTVAERDNEFNIQLKLGNPEPARYFLTLNATEDEYFTGIFERIIDGPQTLSWREGLNTALNLRGENIVMKISPTVSAYSPFYISSEDYSLFVHGTWPGVFDFCKQYPDAVQVSFEGPQMDVTLSIAETPKELVQKHSLEAGPSFIPPDWALGPWRWRDEHFNQETYYDGSRAETPFNTDLVEDILLMKHYDIPATAYWIDRPWAKGYFGYEDFEFDTLKFPEPEKMISWVNSHGMEMMLWIGPMVCGSQAEYAKENGYVLQAMTPDKRRPGGFFGPGIPGAPAAVNRDPRTQQGLSPQGRGNRVPDNLPQRMRVDIFGGGSSSSDIQGIMELIDFTNPEAARWWGENGPGKMAKMGIKGFKLDRADGEMELDSLHLRTHSGITYRENFNDYPRQFIKATYDAVKPVLGNDFILFPRGMYTGSSRYGGMWAGDIRGEPYAFRAALIALQRCAIMGYPIWGADIGGYRGFQRETCMKWLGFGCFSPIMEVGPTENRGFWNNAGEPGYDTELIATWRLYSKTRMKLVPYIKQLVIEANSSGTPLARPLFLEYPDQTEAWIDWQTYMFGKDILVSVIWEEGKNEQNVYLPEGETWIDAWNTGNEHMGGQYVKVKAEAYQIPLFIRKGSSVDLGDLNALYRESLEIAAGKGNMSELEASEGW
jgi:alpha-D-xyloside xylohydrolase